MSHFPCPRTAIILGVIGVLVVGCASSPPTRFYFLDALVNAGKEAQAPAGEPCVSLGVGPVKVSDYLDRHQIVTRVTPNELRLAEFDQWAEPLGQMIPRVLADNLRTLLCTKATVIFPWGRAIPLDYQIEVEIARLDSNLGGNATLDAQWTLFGLKEGKKLLVIKRSNITEPSGSQDYQAKVSAQSRALGHLSREIADAVKTLPQ